MHQFHKFILSRNSTCLGQFVYPSSGVYSLYTQQWYMSYRFVDSFRARAYACNRVSWGRIFKFLLMANLTHFIMYLFISSLYTFWASQCSSSGDQIVLIHHLVWLICVSDCLVCRQEGTPDWHTKQSLTQTNHTRWCINP